MKWPAIACLGLAALSLPIIDRRAPYDRAVESAVEIRVDDSQGMGVFVAEDLVLTAAHVVQGQKEITAHRRGGAGMRCTLVATDTSKDLALLRVAGTGPPLRPGTGARPGDRLFAIGGGFGYSGGHARRTVGSTARFVGYELSARVVEMDCTINFGDSGGPVIDRDGNLAGICSYFDLERNDAYMAIDVSEIRAFLAETAK